MPPSAHVLRAHFDPVAAPAARTEDPLEAAARRLLAELPLRSRVLEVGCGTGQLARALAARRGARVTAIDLVPRNIDVARVRTGASLGIDYRVADFMALSPRGFDAIVAVDTLHELPLAAAAAQMGSGVVPGGLVLIADVHGRELGSLRAIRTTLRGVLPGVQVRRRLGGRYTAFWRRPR